MWVQKHEADINVRVLSVSHQPVTPWVLVMFQVVLVLCCSMLAYGFNNLP